MKALIALMSLFVYMPATSASKVRISFLLKLVFSALGEILGLWKERMMTVGKGNVEGC